MGIKERRTKVLLSLFLMADIDFQPVAMSPMVQTVFDISLNQKTKSTLKALDKDGYIRKVLSEGSTEMWPTYQLTEKGFYDLSLEFPFFRFLKAQWDGRWRILSYEIPESKRDLRDKLRREVAGWGLGPWHRSFWLTPHPIIPSLQNLVSQKEEEKYIQAFESEHTFGDRGILIEKVWAKTKLELKYRELFRKWHQILSTQEEKDGKFQKVVGEYVDLLRVDPGLPKELNGDTWIGYEALSIFKEIRSILTS